MGVDHSDEVGWPAIGRSFPCPPDSFVHFPLRDEPKMTEPKMTEPKMTEPKVQPDSWSKLVAERKRYG